MNCPDWLRTTTGSGAAARRLATNPKQAAATRPNQAPFSCGLWPKARRNPAETIQLMRNHSPALGDFAGLLSGLAAGLASPPAAGFAVLPSLLAGAASFLAASLYLSLR